MYLFLYRNLWGNPWHVSNCPKTKCENWMGHLCVCLGWCCRWEAGVLPCSLGTWQLVMAPGRWLYSGAWVWVWGLGPWCPELFFAWKWSVPLWPLHYVGSWVKLSQTDASLSCSFVSSLLVEWSAGAGASEGPAGLVFKFGKMGTGLRCGFVLDSGHFGSWVCFTSPWAVCVCEIRVLTEPLSFWG